MDNNSVDDIIFYCGPKKQIDNITQGGFIEIVGARVFWEAKRRRISQQEIMEKSPSSKAEGFFHVQISNN